MYVSVLKETAKFVSNISEPNGFNEDAGAMHNIVVESTSMPGNYKIPKNLHNTRPVYKEFP